MFAKLLFVFNVCILLSQSAQLLQTAKLQQNNGSRLQLLNRIIEGVLTEKQTFYEVAILSDDDTNLNAIKICTGSLINVRWIITSAYCANIKQMLKVQYGSECLTTNNPSQYVYKKYIHPNFYLVNKLHDLALLELNPTIAPNAYIKILALPLNTLENYVGKIATISGWGAEGSYLPYSEILNTKQVTVIINGYCEQKYGFYMTPYKLCTERRAICDGDQGAPLVLNNNVLIGIASAALEPLQCEGSYAAAYTRVGRYLTWIKQITNGNCLC